MRPLAAEGRMASIEDACRSAHALSDRVLMGKAAAALEAALMRDGGLEGILRICVLAGRGNNGGDGLALAARLAGSGRWEVSAVWLEGRQSDERAFRLEEARKAGVADFPWPKARMEAETAIASADLLLDAVAGTGLGSALRGEEAALALPWNSSTGRKIAIDLPSGFRDGMESGDPVYESDGTLCIGLEKECLLKPAFREAAGKIVLLEDGIFPAETLASRPDDAFALEESDLAGCLKPFPRDAHKNSRGVVSAFAGSVGGLGAARLCAEAAARCGAGLVRLSVDPELWQAAASGCGGLVVKALESADALSAEEREEAGSASCVLAGPGWGRHESRKKLLAEILSLGRPLVLDADALFALPSMGRKLGVDSIITPHPGEASRLLGWDKRDILEKAREAAGELAGKYGCVAILKSNVSWIASPDGKAFALDASFPPLACAGSGDVLAGIAGGLIARGLPALDAARAAVLVHLRSGKEAWRKKGYFMAQDLLGETALAAKAAEGGDSYVG